MPWSPEARAAAGKRMSERMRALHQDPEFKARQSERMRALHQDPEFKARQSERMRALNQDPEFKARHREASSERMRALHQDPEFKARQSERMRALHQDPEFKARHHFLQGLSDADRKLYQKMRLCGISRDDALPQIKGAAIEMADSVRQFRDDSLIACVWNLFQQGDPLTADQVADKLGETPFNIRPRVSELHNLGLIVPHGEKYRNKSGGMANAWVIAPEEKSEAA